MTHNGGTGRDVYLREVFPSIPFKRCGEESRFCQVSSKSPKDFIISVKDDPISPTLLNSDPIVGETPRGVKVEDP